MKQRFFFKKEERLTGYKRISELFENGYHIKNNSIRTIFRITEENMDYPAKVLFSVPRKNIPGSYLRNRIKRKMREVYRQEKHRLYDILLSQKKKIHIALIFSLKEEAEYELIKTAISESLRKIQSILHNQ